MFRHRLLNKYIVATPEDQQEIETLAGAVLDEIARRAVERLRTASKPDDADSSLRLLLREAPYRGALKDFAQRFGVKVELHDARWMNHEGQYSKATHTITVAIPSEPLTKLWDHYHGFEKLDAKALRAAIEPAYSTLLHELQHAYDDFRSRGQAWFRSSQELQDKGIDEYLRANPEVNARFTQAIRKISPKKVLPFARYRDAFTVEFDGWHVMKEPQRRRLLARLYREWWTLTPQQADEIRKTLLIVKIWDFAYKGRWRDGWDDRIPAVNVEHAIRKGMQDPFYADAVRTVREQGRWKAFIEKINAAAT